MKGKQPAAFDLLYWNSDSTRVPACNHSFYLRHFYLENRLAKGTMDFSGVTLDLGRIEVPSYFLAAKEDHIAPAASVFRGALLFGGVVRYVLAGSGHIAGVINPPAKEKYWFMTRRTSVRNAGGLVRPGGAPPRQLVDRIGSAWLRKDQAPETVPAREPGAGKLPALGDAPGEYVRVRV